MISLRPRPRISGSRCIEWYHYCNLLWERIEAEGLVVGGGPWTMWCHFHTSNIPMGPYSSRCLIVANSWGHGCKMLTLNFWTTDDCKIWTSFWTTSQSVTLPFEQKGPKDLMWKKDLLLDTFWTSVLVLIVLSFLTFHPLKSIPIWYNQLKYFGNMTLGLGFQTQLKWGPGWCDIKLIRYR